MCAVHAYVRKLLDSHHFPPTTIYVVVSLEKEETRNGEFYYHIKREGRIGGNDDGYGGDCDDGGILTHE